MVSDVLAWSEQVNYGIQAYEQLVQALTARGAWDRAQWQDWLQRGQSLSQWLLDWAAQEERP